jgi:signal transduction histidine kinase/ABC-type uncharacterized transport system substrate-binding protein/AmiR/NasT family two-component response regulator
MLTGAKKRIINKTAAKFFAVLTVVACLLCPAANAFAAGTKNVLFINSYSYDFDTVPTVIQGVKSELKGIASIHYLFMNTKYIKTDLAEKLLMQQLDRQMKEFNYDAVILGDDTAFDFAMRYRKKYFPKIPIIFEDINSEEKAREVASDPQIAGVVETFPMRETIAVAKQLMPDAKKVVVITDNTLSAQGSTEQCRAAMKYFPSMGWGTMDCSKLTTDQIARQMASYGKDTILIFTVFSIDGSGRHYSLPDGVRFITAAAKIPVFRADESGIGSGLMGGYVLKYNSVGHETGAMVRDILLGKANVAYLKYKKGSCGYKFDYAVIKKFGIKKSQLPEGSELIHNEPGFYEKNRGVILPLIIAVSLILLIVTFFNLIRRRKFRRELARSEETRRLAEEANRAKSDFLSRMSHDIRTPLNGIIGMTYLAGKHDNPPETAECLKKIDTSSKFLLGLVNDILDMSKAESGKIELHPELYTADTFNGYIDAVIRPLCAEKNQEFTLELRRMPGYIPLVDKLHYNQIFFNLLSNAVKYTPEGGHITLVTIPSITKNGRMAMHAEVRDDGIGISEEFIKTLFEPFTQEGRDDVSTSRGSGLGLAITKRLVESMDGTIAVKSKLGQGTTFVVDLEFDCIPAQKNNDSSSAGAESQAGRSTDVLAGKHVLLCEDHPLNQEIAKALLSEKKMIVETADNGQLGVEEFRRSAVGFYDAILMDVRMPVMNGYEATAAIRGLARPDAKTIPIIAMTANAFEEDKEKSRAAGMNAHLSKPIDPQIMFGELSNLISKAEDKTDS